MAAKEATETGLTEKADKEAMEATETVVALEIVAAIEVINHLEEAVGLRFPQLLKVALVSYFQTTLSSKTLTRMVAFTFTQSTSVSLFLATEMLKWMLLEALIPA